MRHAADSGSSKSIPVLFISALILTIIGLLWVVFFPVWQDPMRFFDNRRSKAVEFQVDSAWTHDGISFRSLRVQGWRSPGNSSTAVEFDAYFCRPQQEKGLLPAFVLIGGFRTGGEVIQIIARRPYIARLGAFITLDYPYTGPEEFSGLDILPYVPRIRKGLFDGVESIRLALDYLDREEGIDTSRIVLLGVSLGAFYAVDAGGVDPRPDAVMAFMGGGDLKSLFEWSLQRTGYVRNRFLYVPLAELISLMIRPLEPKRLVGRIAPRPYIQVSAENDVMVPESNALALFEAAGEPRKLIWIPAPHVLPGMQELIEQMITIAQRELTELQIL